MQHSVLTRFADQEEAGFYIAKIDLNLSEKAVDRKKISEAELKMFLVLLQFQNVWNVIITKTIRSFQKSLRTS